VGKLLGPPVPLVNGSRRCRRLTPPVDVGTAVHAGDSLDNVNPSPIVA
jgi:hypothetical protein